jgi:perosamine synthetase
MNIPCSQPSLGALEEQYLLEALRSGWVSSTGDFVLRFERGLADLLGLPFGVATSNGTTALHLALAALGIGPGDEVLVPNLTFAATANAAFMAGARPVLVDSLPDHWNMDPAQAEAACNGRTRAMIVVHLLGHACDMGPLLDLARRRGLKVVEDCAEALGCTWEGRPVGALGDIGTFSFYGNKVITTGEGGLCATADPELERRLRVLRAHGMSPQRQYWHEVVGFNYRMTNLNAALGVAQLERMGELLARRRALRELYDSQLTGLPGVRIRFSAPGRTIDWLYPLFLEGALAARRDDFLEGLHAQGVDARPMFHPLHLMPPFAGLPRSPSLEHSARWGGSGLLLPLYPALEDDQVRRIAGHLADLAAGLAG